jgi:carboxylesterase type B
MANLPEGIDVLAGSNHNEGDTFVYAALSDELPTFLYEGAIDGIFGSTDGAKILDYYKAETPKGALADARDVLGDVLTDFWFRCATQQFATGAVAAHGRAYFYHFQHVFSSSWIFGKVSC